MFSSTVKIYFAGPIMYHEPIVVSANETNHASLYETIKLDGTINLIFTFFN